MESVFKFRSAVNISVIGKINLKFYHREDYVRTFQFTIMQ